MFVRGKVQHDHAVVFLLCYMRLMCLQYQTSRTVLFSDARWYLRWLVGTVKKTRHIDVSNEAKPVSNRSSSCHVAASKDGPGWKAGHCVAFCVPCSACSRESSEIATEFIQSTSSSSSNSSSAKPSNNKSCNPCSNRTCLTLERRHETMQFAKDNTTWGYRKLAKKFGVGKTQKRHHKEETGNFRGIWKQPKKVVKTAKIWKVRRH